MKYALTLAASLSLLGTAPANADITIFDTPGALQPEEQVLLQTPTPGNTMVFGVTNQTSSGVTFLGVETLDAQASGQARVIAADGGFSTLEFFLTDPLQAFTEIEFNINSSTATSVNLSFTAQFGNVFSDMFALDINGENFFSARAVNNQLIRNFSFTANGDVLDLRQVRVGGIQAVPEPATWAMLIIGFAVSGAAIRRRRLNYKFNSAVN